MLNHENVKTVFPNPNCVYRLHLGKKKNHFGTERYSKRPLATMPGPVSPFFFLLNKVDFQYILYGSVVHKDCSFVVQSFKAVKLFEF